MERAKKAVVIGAEGYSMATDEVAVSCYSWKNIKKIKNICDYDYVLVNLLSISDENSRNDVDWKQVNTVLCLKNTLEVLRHKGLIVIVGDPRFSTSITSETKSIQKPFLDWTGMLFIWDNSPGDTIDSLSHQFRFYQDYVDRLKKWSYSLSDVLANDEKRDEILRVIGRSGDALSIKASKRSICQNRYRKDLIFQAGLCVTQREQYPKTNQSKLLVNFGDIVFLPPIDASKEETLLITMYRMFGIEASSPEPQWGDSCKVPNQELYLGKIGDVELEIQVLREHPKKDDPVVNWVYP